VGPQIVNLPRSSAELLERGELFQKRLEELKRTCVVADYGWYPHAPLSALPIVTGLLAEDFEEVAALLAAEPVADLGCADGDFALLFAHLGAEVDAIDHAESNFNQMRGIDVLKRQLESSTLGLKTYDVDLDGRFELPRDRYGLVLFLGTLYHLKNPFYVLETLAGKAAYCILSTRIAQVTFKTGVEIESEPVAYLLEPREANNDPTNFWIFSEAGLMRLLARTGWMVRARITAGCLTQSNPVEPRADQRIFLLLKSRTRYPDLHVRVISGWHEVEQDAWRWTMKRFSLEVVLPKDRPAREFALKFTVPEVVIAGSPTVRIKCSIGGEPAGSIMCDSPCTIEFRGVFPESALAKPEIVLDFEIESSFASPGDERDLGILVPLLDRLHVSTGRLPFRIS
jgi:tRNA (mo5U34)-methyltransferase